MSIKEKIKNILRTNIVKSLKKIVSRVGKFLIAILQLSIPLLYWIIFGYIDQQILAVFTFGAYVAWVELSCSSIVDIFKANGNGNGHSEPPQ